MAFSNQLKPIQLERLSILSEECSEVIKEINKIIRHGPNSYHPEDRDKITNVQRLEKELGDIQAAKELLAEIDFINLDHVEQYAKLKKELIGQWLHYKV